MKDKIVCACFNVTEENIVNAIREHNITTIAEVRKYTNASAGGKNCKGNDNAT